MCVLLKDNEMLNFANADELKQYLDFRISHDRWMVAPIHRMKVYTCNGTADEFRKETGAVISDEVIEACKNEGTNMFVKFYTEVNGVEKKGTIPLRYTAIRSLLDRAKIGGASIYNDIPEAGIDVLPLDKKVEIINTCLQLYTAQAKILYRDEKASCIMSGQYAVLAEKEIIDAVENGMKESFPKAAFQNGNVSHESFRAEYKLNADEIEEDILIALNDAGIGTENVHAMLGIFTSDIGSAAATVYSYLDVDGHRMYFGKPHAVKHIGKRTAEDIGRAIKKVYTMFENNAADMKLLAETQINNPSGCLRLIAKEFKLPKKIAMAVSYEMEENGVESCTAYEIFWYLNEIVRRFEEEKKDVFRAMNLQETVSETVKINFKRFDKPFEWARATEED